MKKKIVIILVGLLLFIPLPLVSADESIALFVNGNYTDSDVEPIINNGRVLLPIRTISSAVGVNSDNIHWDKTTKMVTILNNDRVIQLTLYKKTMIINGVELELDVPAKMVNDRTMLPLRNVAQALGLEVIWNSKTRTVIINSTDRIAEEIREKEGINNINRTEGTEEKLKLTSKEIAKLRDRVGIVYTIDDHNNIISQGSGFFLSKDGLFVTNYHVVEETGIFKVIMQNGRIFFNNGYYTIASSKSDIFAVYLTEENEDTQNTNSILDEVNYFNVNLKLPEVGDKIYVIGSPEGLENTLSQGLVSGIRTYDGKKYIQIDASITHGSSGGALINEKGELIGITSNGIEGTDLNFAIPIKYFDDLYKQVIEKEEPYYD